MQKIITDMDSFIKNINTEELLNKASVVAIWDFNTALGSTIIERYESMTVKIMELSNVLIRKGAKGYFWVICSPETTTMFDVNTKFKHNEKHEYYPMGLCDKLCIGVLDKRWRIYMDTTMDASNVLIGHDSSCEPEDLARIKIGNHYI